MLLLYSYIVVAPKTGARTLEDEASHGGDRTELTPVFAQHYLQEYPDDTCHPKQIPARP